VRESLRSMTPVFSAGDLHDGLSADRHPLLGEEWFRVMMYRRGAIDRPLDEVMRHESVHVAQEVRDQILFADGASDALLSHAGGVGRRTSKWLVVDVVRPLAFLDAGLGLTMHAARGTSWLRDTYSEREAFMFSGVLPCSADGRTRCAW